MKNKIKKIASAQAATLDVSLQTTDSVRHTMTTSNTAIAPCGTPCPTIPKMEILPPLKSTTITLETLCKVATSEIDAMSFKELDGFIDLGINCIALNQASIIRARQAMKPALIRIHDMLSNRGIRNDLNDVPVITWKTFCHNKKMLGCKRTLDELIKVAGLENPDKQPKLIKGDKVVLLADGTDRPVSYTGEVTHIHEKTNPNDFPKVEVTYKTADGTKKDTVPTTAVEKIPVVKKHL